MATTNEGFVSVWMTVLPTQRDDAFLAVHCERKQSNVPPVPRSNPTCSNVATDDEAGFLVEKIMATATLHDDRLRAVLVCLRSHQYWTTSSLPVGSIQPAGVRVEAYCALLDDLLRNGYNQHRVEVPISYVSDDVCEVQLKVRLEEGGLMVLNQFSFSRTHDLSDWTDLWKQITLLLSRTHFVSQFAMEQWSFAQKLRRDVKLLATDRLTDQETFLLSVKTILNEKKKRIRQLTALLEQERKHHQTLGVKRGRDGSTPPDDQSDESDSVESSGSATDKEGESISQPQQGNVTGAEWLEDLFQS